MSFFRFSKITLRAHKFFIFFNRLKLFKTFSNQSTYLKKIHSDKIFGFRFSSSILKAHSSPNQNVIKDSRILVIKNDSRILVNIDIGKREHANPYTRVKHANLCTRVKHAQKQSMTHGARSMKRKREACKAMHKSEAYKFVVKHA